MRYLDKHVSDFYADARDSLRRDPRVWADTVVSEDYYDYEKPRRQRYARAKKNKAMREIQQQRWQQWLWFQEYKRQYRRQCLTWGLIVLLTLTAPFLLFKIRTHAGEIRSFVTQQVHSLTSRSLP